MSLTKAALHFAVPLPKLESFKRYLFIGPHPDDIEIGAGALAAKLAAAGKEVFFLICLDGRFGGGNRPDLSPDELAALRKAEARASAARLGAREPVFLDLCDGGFYEYDELERSVARAVGEIGPDVIFAPDPSVESECHKDHLNVGRAAKTVACFAPYGGIMDRYGAKAADVKALALYFTARPNRFVSTAGCFEKQLDAIFGCHESQFPEASSAASSLKLYLTLRAREHGLLCFSRSGEAYRVLEATRMHCLPEGE